MEKVSILVADDHKIIRDSLIMSLNAVEEFEVVGEAANGLQALRQMELLHPDIVLLDLSMPSHSGLEVLEKLFSVEKSARIIVLTSYTDASYIDKCLNFGVDGYIIKSAGLDEIIQAIRWVNDGHRYISPQAQSAYFESMQTKKSKTVAVTLTRREKEIISYVNKGLTSSQIAEKLYISYRTVETHRSNIMKKIGATNTIELINKCKELNLIP